MKPNDRVTISVSRSTRDMLVQKCHDIYQSLVEKERKEIHLWGSSHLSPIPSVTPEDVILMMLHMLNEAIKIKGEIQRDQT